MIEQTLAIARNTFSESIRQPIMLVVLVVATIAIIMANPLSAFTMDNDQRMLLDMGTATIFLCGALLAAFIATNVLGREIENRTVLTVVSKPVWRPLFVIGKYLGVAAALTVATLYMAFVFLLVEQHTVLQTVRDPLHLPVLLFGSLAGVIGVGVGVWCNYFYNKPFGSIVICVTTPLAGLAWLFSMMFRPDFTHQDMSVGFKPQLWLAMIGLLVAILILTAVAVAASTRLGQVLTLAVTLGVFMLGMLSDWMIGARIRNLEQQWTQVAKAQNKTERVDRVLTARIDNAQRESLTNSEKTDVATEPLFHFASTGEKVEYGLWWTAYAAIPNFQVLFLGDALTQKHLIPPGYVVRTSVYGVCYIVAVLGAAVFLFQTREVG